MAYLQGFVSLVVNELVRGVVWNDCNLGDWESSIQLVTEVL